MKTARSETIFSTRNLLIGFMVLFLVAYVLFDGPFCYSSVCTQCGKRRNSRDWMVPFSRIKLGTDHRETDSPLSAVLHQKQIVPEHAHQWLFIHGSGNGVMCAIGNGSSMLSMTTSKDLAATVELLHDRQQEKFRDRLIRGVLDYKTTPLYLSAATYPPPPTVTDAQFEEWVEARSQNLDDLLRVHY